MPKKIGAVAGLVIVLLVVVGFVLSLVPTAYNANKNGRIFSFAESDDAGFATGAGSARNSVVMNSLDLAVSEEMVPSVVSQKAVVGNQIVAQDGEMTAKKIIRDGSLGLFVISPEEAIKQVEELAKVAGGFVQNSQIYEVRNGVKAGSVIIRVPADKFEATITEIKKLAKEIDREEVDSRDVTEQFIDLEARLHNAQAEEARYLEIMGRAQTIKDTLDVSERLGSVRERIEILTGQLQYLSRQVDMSTINVSLSSYDDVKVFGLRWRPLYEIKKSFREMLTGLTSYIDTMLALIINLPVIILWIVTVGFILWVIWKLLRWINRRFIKKNAPDIS
jgi:hypothetical protein